MAPLRSLQVVHNLGMGGAETWLIEALRFWSRSGQHQADFLLTGGQPGIFDDEARALGARVFYAQYSRSTLAAFVREFRAILDTGRYDAIHDHQDYISGWHFLFGIGRLPPVRVAHVHNPRLHITANYASGPMRKLSTAIGKRLVNRMATQVCGTSVEILKEYGFHPCSPSGPAVTAAYCGNDVGRYTNPQVADRASVRREFGWSDDTKIVLMVGRLDRVLSFDHPTNHKNTWLAINIARTASKKDSGIRLLAAGEGASRAALQKSLDDWSLNDRFRLLGVRSDVPRLMRAADALLFPSRQEGLGMAAVEAQAASLPVLASTAVPRECVVIPEIYMALPLDRPADDWADSLLAIMAKPRMAPEACYARLCGTRFSIEVSANRLEAIYRGQEAL